MSGGKNPLSCFSLVFCVGGQSFKTPAFPFFFSFIDFSKLGAFSYLWISVRVTWEL